MSFLLHVFVCLLLLAHHRYLPKYCAPNPSTCPTCRRQASECHLKASVGLQIRRVDIKVKHRVRRLGFGYALSLFKLYIQRNTAQGGAMILQVFWMYAISNGKLCLRKRAIRARRWRIECLSKWSRLSQDGPEGRRVSLRVTLQFGGDSSSASSTQALSQQTLVPGNPFFTIGIFVLLNLNSEHSLAGHACSRGR